MIDIENKIIDTLQTALTTAQISCDLTSEYVDSPESFPHVYARMTSNSTYQRTQDTSLQEHHATIRFRIEAFSNKTYGAKEEIKTILGVLDVAMQNMKFTRTSFNFIPNYDRSIQRAYSDYSAVVMEGVTAKVNGVDTTTYQMYRR